MAAAVQRIAIEAERHRFTFRQTRRTVFMRFSMMVIQASEHRSCFGKPSRVRSSSMPSRIDPRPVPLETLGVARYRPGWILDLDPVIPTWKAKRYGRMAR